MFSVILRSEATKNPVNSSEKLTGFFASLRMTIFSEDPHEMLSTTSYEK